MTITDSPRPETQEEDATIAREMRAALERIATALELPGSPSLVSTVPEEVERRLGALAAPPANLGFEVSFDFSRLICSIWRAGGGHLLEVTEGAARSLLDGLLGLGLRPAVGKPAAPEAPRTRVRVCPDGSVEIGFRAE